eukprot:12399920-Karenia_brevis.AAC.1
MLGTATAVTPFRPLPRKRFAFLSFICCLCSRTAQDPFQCTRQFQQSRELSFNTGSFFFVLAAACYKYALANVVQYPYVPTRPTLQSGSFEGAVKRRNYAGVLYHMSGLRVIPLL